MTTPPSRPRFLVVDDDGIFRDRLVKALTDRGFPTRGAEHGERALQLLAIEPAERVVLDLRMPGANGLDIIPQIGEVAPESDVVVLTGYGSIATALEAVRRGALSYLTKPVDVEEILIAFEKGIDGVAADAPSEVPSLARVEWEHIQRVLVECDGNISEAARVLGIHRRSLQRKLGKHPVKR